MGTLSEKVVVDVADALIEYESGQPDRLIGLFELIQDAQIARLIFIEKGYGIHRSLTQIAQLSPNRERDSSTE